MFTYPSFLSPILFSVGPITLRWYGLMYAVSFWITAQHFRKQAKEKFLPMSPDDVEKFFVAEVISLLVGARIFYVLFYQPKLLEDGLMEVIAIWHGGLSFHGGLVGVVLTGGYFALTRRVPWAAITDTIVLVGPVGIFFGRIGNFMNAELFGRVTTMPWGMVFPNAGPEPRHISQFYEATLEGVVLFALLWFLKPRVKRYGVLSGIFLCGYAVARTFCEFFREPDAQLGFVWGPFTMGQLLSFFILFIPGLFLWRFSLKKGVLVDIPKSVH